MNVLYYNRVLTVKRNTLALTVKRNALVNFNSLCKGGMGMQITDIRLRIMDQDSKMRAIVSVTFDDVFVVHDIKVIKGGKGLFVAMPSKMTPSGEFRDIVHPINADMRAKLNSEIIEKYESTVLELSGDTNSDLKTYKTEKSILNEQRVLI